MSSDSLPCSPAGDRKPSPEAVVDEEMMEEVVGRKGEKRREVPDASAHARS